MRFTVWMNRDALLAFSKDDLIALILAQQAQIEALGARIAELEARLNAPQDPGQLEHAAIGRSRCDTTTAAISWPTTSKSRSGSGAWPRATPSSGSRKRM